MRRDRTVVVDVVEAIAEVEGTTPHELPYTLHEHVDTEALDALASMDTSEWELRFSVPGHEVRVDGEGRIRVDGRVVRGPEPGTFMR